MKSLFKTESGRREILEAYDQKLKDLNIQHELRFVDTSFGKTHVIISGQSSNPPLLIVHGSNGCAPISLDCYPNLSRKFQVFAVDVLGQPNKSEGTKMSMKDDSYGRWMNELMDQLKIKDVVLLGFSMGGLIILKTLVYNEAKAKEVFLASPAYIVNGNPLKALFKIFIPMKRYMSTQKEKHIKKFLSVLFSESDDFAVHFLSKVFLEFDMDFTPVPMISKKDAQKIKTPITLIAADGDVLFPGKKMIKRAQNIFPSLIKTILLKPAKHVQNRRDNSLVEELILR